MARINYRGWNLPDGTEIPDVPADLQRLVDSTILNVPRYVGGAVAPAPFDPPQNAAWAEWPAMRVSVTLNEQHMLRVSAMLKMNVVTAAVNTPNAGINRGTGAANPNLLRLIANTTGNATLPIGYSQWSFGSVFVHQAAGTSIYTITANGGGATGTTRFGGDGTTVNSCLLYVEDFGVLV